MSATPHATHFHAGYNMPGYLPEAEPATFETWDEARSYMAAELREHAYNVASWAEEHDCAEQRASSLTLAADLLDQEGGPSWDDQVDGMAYWITPCEEPGCADDDDDSLVTCATCGERHWYLVNDDGMTHMTSLSGYTCGQEEPEPEPKSYDPNCVRVPVLPAGHAGLAR